MGLKGNIRRVPNCLSCHGVCDGSRGGPLVHFPGGIYLEGARRARGSVRGAVVDAIQVLGAWGQPVQYHERNSS